MSSCDFGRLSSLSFVLCTLFFVRFALEAFLDYLRRRTKNKVQTSKHRDQILNPKEPGSKPSPQLYEAPLRPSLVVPRRRLRRARPCRSGSVSLVAALVSDSLPAYTRQSTRRSATRMKCRQRTCNDD